MPGRTTNRQVREMKQSQFNMIRSKLAGVEAVAARTDRRFAPHTHEQFGIGVIEYGAQKSLSGRGTVEAGAGDVITVNPGEVHDGAPIGDAGRAWRMLYIDPALIAEAADDIREGQTATYEFSLPVIHDEGIAHRFRQLFASLTANAGTQPAALPEELLLMLLADVMHESSSIDAAHPVPGAISRARTLIDDDPLAPVTLSDLARESGLSRYQVLRGFAKATGLTPHAYLVQRRIHLARRLIAQGMPLAEAAAASGFADQSHMTRIFVRKYGVSPRAYACALA